MVTPSKWPEYFKPEEATTDNLIERIQYALELGRSPSHYNEFVGDSQQYMNNALLALDELQQRFLQTKTKR